MERLTFEGNFCDIAQCRENPCPYNNSCTQREVWERLKAYEDTELSPRACENAAKAEAALSSAGWTVDRAAELIKANKEGRVVVLPCKVGDTVYYRCGKRITDFEVVGFSMDKQGASIIYAEHHADENGTAYSCFFDIGKIGRTVFFTREEALRRAENG